ncbi:MAG: purine-nucleoside phosphorylase [Bacteroidetes bacterium]|nr:purine-nucleoside phosphorylase [Rhodothermia bacterium]MCS7154679.1 purine-nucleoside phosphorylase [Bacteroidota bacterium]MCX7906396.1 purine-nucleoside phosphorylase [Bacteroidota bacterium]MDW8137472.1 purine-nucleoside phosphorylase [Bacteroidota bacterium]MDW8285574.1 purine-nucleoside phosphorylase [Bacteroidota bacterium]
MPISVEELRRQLAETVTLLRARTALRPRVGIILGTGLGSLAEHIELELVVPYEQIPHFPLSTVESHTGRLLFGHLEGHPVVAMQGRFHYYEGYTMQQITYPVRVMKKLGAEMLFVSNAAGGMNPLFRRGDVMLIVDHINLLGDNPLIGPNDPELGPRFPDMSAPYDPELCRLAEEVALEAKIKLQQGVYVAVAGPNLETRAEYRFLRWIGADAVGMSTVPEVIVARHMDMRVLGLSVITDECFPEALRPLTHEEVVAAAQEAEPKLTEIFRRVLRRLASSDRP